MNDNSRLVYSTERVLPRKEKLPARTTSTVDPAKQRIVVRLDRKGRCGKSVTLVEGLQLADQDREALLKQLKAKLGTGGAVKNGTLEIQGDHRDGVTAHLCARGYSPRREGG